MEPVFRIDSPLDDPELVSADQIEYSLMDSSTIVVIRTEMPMNLGTVCRGCLTIDETGGMHSIHGDPQIAEMLMLLASIRVEQRADDHLPQLICDSCISSLAEACKFKRQLEEIDNALRDLCAGAASVNESSVDRIGETYQPMSPCVGDTMGKVTSSPSQEGLGDAEEHDEVDNVLESSDSNGDYDKCPGKPSRSYTCTECDKTFLNAKKYEQHVNQHASSFKASSFTCEECQDSFVVENDLRIHSSLHANDGNFTCLGCSKSCGTMLKLRRHIRIHYTDKPYKCSSCGMGFPEMAALTRHFKKKHDDKPRQKNHLCTICGQRYYDSYSLNVHTRRHNNVKPYSCMVCEKQFVDIRLLTSHMRIHSDLKAYTCEVCSKSFTHLGSLNSHRRIHTGEKPYSCKQCDKKFTQSSNLALHQRQHGKPEDQKLPFPTRTKTNEIPKCPT